MAILEAVFANKAGQTPQDVERRRKMAEELLKAGTGTKPPSSGLELAGRLAMTLSGQYQAGKAERQDATNRANANSLLAKTLLGEDPYSPASSGASASPVPMTGAANEMSGGGGPQSYRDAIAGIESAGSGDYSAVGPTDPKLGRALGRYQVMEANIGPWSQEALGRAVTPDEFLADPKLQDAIFDKKFGSYVQQYGPQGAAQAWFAGPGGVGKLDRKDSLGTTVSAYGDKFSRALGGNQQVASLDPAAGLSQSPSPQQAASAVPAPMQGPTPAAPAFPPPTTIASAPPVASVPQQQPASLMSSAVPGQAPSAPQMMAQTSPSKRAQIAALLQNPYTQEAGQQMLMQEYERQQQAQNIILKQQLEQNDPKYRQDLEKGQLELQNLREPKLSPAEQANIDLNREKFSFEKNKPTEVNGRLIGPDGKVIYDSPMSAADQARLDLERQKFEADRNKPTEVNGRLVGPDGKVVYDSPMSAADEARLKLDRDKFDAEVQKGQWQKMTDGRLYNQTTGEFKDAPPPAPGSVTPKFDDVSGMRKEIQQLPAYKNLAAAAPIYKAMSETAGRDSKASDLNLVYGLGKIMDPTSVVREGEMIMVKNTASLPDWLQGAISSLNGGAALTPETRQAIMTEAYGRVKGYNDEFQQNMGQYQGIVQRNGINPADVIPEIDKFEPWTAPAAAPVDPAAPAVPPAATPPPAAGINKTTTGIPWKVIK